jgi:hypothetical protein
LAYFSEGAISIADAYDLPIHLRNFYLKCLEEAKKREKEQLEKQNDFKPGQIVKKP